MQFKNIAFSAFAATALAQSASQTENVVSILSVLQTALPSSLVAEALTNSAAVSSQIASQFAAGATPSWFTGLPSDVQTYLVPPQATGALGGNGTATNGTIIGGGNSTSNGTSSSSSSTRGRMTMTNTDGSSATGGSGGSGSGSQSTGAGFQSSSESGNAAAPTAIIGAGLAGAVGFVGLLAL